MLLLNIKTFLIFDVKQRIIYDILKDLMLYVQISLKYFANPSPELWQQHQMGQLKFKLQMLNKKFNQINIQYIFYISPKL